MINDAKGWTILMVGVTLLGISIFGYIPSIVGGISMVVAIVGMISFRYKDMRSLDLLSWSLIALLFLIRSINYVIYIGWIGDVVAFLILVPILIIAFYNIYQGSKGMKSKN